MSHLKAIHKIKPVDRDEMFLVVDYRADENLSLTVLDVNKCEAFRGSISDKELQSLAVNIRMSFSSFIDLTQKALTQNKYDGLQFLYCLEKNCQGFVFKWKSVDSDETTVTLGVVNVIKNEYQSAIKDVLSNLSTELLNLNKKILNVEAELTNSLKEKLETQQLLDESINSKQKIEFELYSKFVLVLNKKKRKISELRRNAIRKPSKRAKITGEKVSRKIGHRISDSDSETVDSVDSTSAIKPQAAKCTGENVSRKIAHQISDSDSETVDSVNSSSAFKPEAAEIDEADVNEAGPSNLKRDDSLLFFDDEEPKVSISPSKIRNRNARNVTAVSDLPEHIQAACSQIYDSDPEDLLLQM